MEAAEATEALLAPFGDLAEAIGASGATLAAIPALGEEGAAVLKAIEAAVLRIEGLRAARRPALRGRRAVLDYLDMRRATQAEGELRALYLDARNRLLADEIVGAGTERDRSLLPARVLRRALALDAAAIVLVRRIGGAAPVPDAQERDLALRMAEAAGLMCVTLRDYLLVAGKGGKGHASVMVAPAG
jgi:DNA repair protein RadC